MSRRHRAEVRKMTPDAKYNSETIAKLINYLMLEGKKSVAEKIVYEALDIVSKKANKPAIEAFSESIDNIRPAIEVRSRRVGGATYQVPTEVRPKRALALALKWLILSARKRSEKEMKLRLAAEMLDALNNKGSAVKKREDTHKMADANKAFAHFRW